MRDVTRYVRIFVIEIDMAFRGRELFGTFKIDIYANDWFLRVLFPSSLCHLAYYRLRFLALAAIAVGVNILAIHLFRVWHKAGCAIGGFVIYLIK